jgi:hypothetical protein
MLKLRLLPLAAFLFYSNAIKKALILLLNLFHQKLLKILGKFKILKRNQKKKKKLNHVLQAY